MAPGITWYDVLGVMPDASPQEIRRHYDSKIALLRPELIAGQPSPVLVATSRARDILLQAWRTLGDPTLRARYDTEAGIRPRGGGPAVNAGLRQPGRATVPDVRGLFYSVCPPVASRAGLRVAVVRLTAHPMPVDGLVVSQSPQPQARARRGSALTVQIWHPPRRV